MNAHGLWLAWRRCALGWLPLWILFGLNAFDGVVTHCFLSAGWAEELNPLMDLLWTRSPLAFGAFKIVAACGAVVMLRLGRESEFVAFLLLFVLAIYGVLTCVHLFWLSQVFWRTAELLPWISGAMGALAIIRCIDVRAAPRWLRPLRKPL